MKFSIWALTHVGASECVEVASVLVTQSGLKLGSRLPTLLLTGLNELRAS